MLYMDNMLIVALTKDQIQYIANQLHFVFILKDLGEVRKFLEHLVVCDRTNKVIKISQGLYIKKILKEKGWTHFKRARSLLDVNVKYNPNSLTLENKEKKEFVELVGNIQ